MSQQEINTKAARHVWLACGRRQILLMSKGSKCVIEMSSQSDFKMAVIFTVGEKTCKHLIGLEKDVGPKWKRMSVI